MKNLKGLFLKSFAGAAAGAATLGVLTCKAVADTDLTNSVTTVANSMKENALAVLVIAIPVALIVIMVIWGFRVTLRLAGIRGR